MKTQFISFLLVFLVPIFGFTQSLQFISQRTSDPLSNVSVFDLSGNLLATSDIEGNILKENLKPFQNEYSLIYEGYSIGKLHQEDLQKEKIKLNDRVADIQEVKIYRKNNAKYIYVKGNFNAYLMLDKQLNTYCDGIVTYIFDAKTLKLKDTKIEQYRVFLKTAEHQDRKNVGSLVYDSFLKLPDLKKTGKIKEYITDSNNKYKKIQTGDLYKIQYQSAALQTNVFSVLGYQLYDFQYINAFVFLENTLNIRDFSQYNEIVNFKSKHKSEGQFHQFTKYANFLTTEISFDNSDMINEVEFKTNTSYYFTNYWEEPSFPNMQPVFISFFKDTLKEQKNTDKK